MAIILLDSGPMVALFNRRDRWHTPILKYVKEFRGEFITSSANVTEAAWLTSRASQKMLLNLLKWLEREAVTIYAIETNDLRRISELTIKYSDLNPDFADLALLSLAERIKVDTVLTLDKADFSIYRLKNGKHLKNVLAH